MLTLFAPPVPLPVALVDAIPVCQDVPRPMSRDAHRAENTGCAIPEVRVIRDGDRGTWVSTTTWNEGGYTTGEPSMGDTRVRRHSQWIGRDTSGHRDVARRDASYAQAVQDAVRQAQVTCADAQIVHDLLVLDWPLEHYEETRRDPHGFGDTGDGTFTVEWWGCPLLPGFSAPTELGLEDIGVAHPYVRTRLQEMLTQYVASGEQCALQAVRRGEHAPFAPTPQPEPTRESHTCHGCDSCGDCHGCEPQTYAWRVEGEGDLVSHG